MYRKKFEPTFPNPQHWNSSAWSPFFEAGRGEDVIEGGGEEPPVVLPADQAVAHEAELHAQAAKYDTRHHRKSRESTRRLLNSIRGIKRKAQESSVLHAQAAEYDTRHYSKPRGSNVHTCKIRYAASFARIYAQYTSAAKYDTRHHRKSRESTHRLLNSISGIK
jgi:hypothetical protein